MRKSLVLLTLLVTISAVAATFTVQRILANAVSGERAAAARYDGFAAQADKDGYAGVACLFRAQAQAERIHESRFVKAMTDRGIPVPANETGRINVASTERNLQTAISLEQAERDSTYLYAINTCNEAREEAVAKLFDVTRDSETEHANLCATALRKLESMKTRQVFYVCPICGYTTDVRLSICPSCQHKGALDSID